MGCCISLLSLCTNWVAQTPEMLASQLWKLRLRQGWFLLRTVVEGLLQLSPSCWCLLAIFAVPWLIDHHLISAFILAWRSSSVCACVQIYPFIYLCIYLLIYL
jgi:hypothetical protein